MQPLFRNKPHVIPAVQSLSQQVSKIENRGAG